MKSIVLQQLELEFGDDFHDMYNNTKSYVKGLIGKPWWKDKWALIQSEGPLSSMVEQCMVYIYEAGDKLEGFKSYTSYLTDLYGSSVARNNTQSGWYDSDLIVWSTMGTYNRMRSASRPLGSSTLTEEHVQDEDDDSIFDDEHEDFLEVYVTMGAEAAAEEFGITQKQARARRNTIKATISRRLEDQVD